MSDTMAKVDEWLMRFFLAHPNVKATVGELSKRCHSELKELQSRFSWQQVAGYFMHNLTTHHMQNERLTQSAPTGNESSLEFIYGLSYQVTVKGQDEFTTFIRSI